MAPRAPFAIVLRLSVTYQGWIDRQVEALDCPRQRLALDGGALPFEVCHAILQLVLDLLELLL